MDVTAPCLRTVCPTLDVLTFMLATVQPCSYRVIAPLAVQTVTTQHPQSSKPASQYNGSNPHDVARMWHKHCSITNTPHMTL